ncbi:DUF4350 domain-containing protein [Aurantiacibacter sp. D1-12]|uniref:DUF4350 domain-containing protein n=1 Tax=Aurantiacibacter sp. D1-12 TaxID=2993658 RepID=UPI00237D198E|nr:DUF4350 domain-containing protein [Aurantiacibacter sp. D1-12]MDE1467184.1 DUF4350 domain-containing protein [Aurantiacibacter sp. D1-12]
MSQVAERRSNPFRPGVVLAVLLVGAGAFLLMLYALGQGWTGNEERAGQAHAASDGLPGFSGLAQLLESTGYTVELSRNRGRTDEYGLVVLTPGMFGNIDELNEIVQERRDLDAGPTLIIMPKWMAFPVPEQWDTEAQEDWVVLGGAMGPVWTEEFALTKGGEIDVGQTNGWNGFGQSGELPQSESVQALTSQGEEAFRSLVVDSETDVLVGALEQEQFYDDYPPWPVIVVFEPDLMNNFGLADRNRAEVAMGIIATATEGEDMPIIFDLTLPGLGASENLLTLAFRPPFLAATLCLIFAALVIAWRAFRRFGPPIAEAPAMARGKQQLAQNGAALVARVKRFHLLSDPYAALMSKRIAEALGIRETNPEARDVAIDRALERRGFDGPGFASRRQALREANGPRDIIRAAGALKSIERMLKR